MSRKLPAEVGRSRAIVMGTWRYNEPALGSYLPAVENSFRRFTDLLSGPLCGWPEDSITSVSNEANPGRLPDLLMTQFGEAKDVALFYYVGHGLISDDEDAELCLGLTGSVSKDPRRRAPTSLEFPSVRRALLKSSARTKIVILDCCNSGTVLKPVLAGTGVTSPDTVPAEFLDGADVEGSYVLVAAARNKNAYYELGSDSDSPQTYFTKYLAELIERGIEGGPSELTMEILFSRLRSSLVAGGHSRPDRRNVQFGGEYPFCRNAMITVTSPRPASLSPGRPQPVVPPPRAHEEEPAHRPDAASGHAERAPVNRAVFRGRRMVQLGALLVAASAIATGILLIMPTPSHHAKTSAVLSYAFTPAIHNHGLVIDRTWSVDGSGDAIFTESLAVANPTDSTVHASYAEMVPAALRTSIAKAHFTSSMPKVSDSGAVLDWALQVPAHGHVSYSYQVHISSTMTQTELTEWASGVNGPMPSPSAGAKPLKSLAIHPASLRIIVGDNIRLKLSGRLADGQEAPQADLTIAIWQSSDYTVLAVAANGTITAVEPGTARVTVRVGELAARISVTVIRAVTQTPSAGYTYQAPSSEQASQSPSQQPSTHPPATHSASSSPTAVPTVTPSPI